MLTQNILKTADVSKVYLVYKNEYNVLVKENVTLRYMDAESCYFSAEIKQNFKKPKKKIPIELWVYTPEGVYKTKTVLTNVTYSLDNIMFLVKTPQRYDFIQLRAGLRVEAELKFNIKYDDGLVISGVTHDIAVGGVSFVSDTYIPSIYRKIPATFELELSKDMIMSFPDRRFVCKCTFVRAKEAVDTFGGKLYAYKFVKLSKDDSDTLINFILSLTF